MSKAGRAYSPREAWALAEKLGWTVAPKRRSGDIVFTTPAGERYTCRAPGRDSVVPLRLARALDAAARAGGMSYLRDHLARDHGQGAAAYEGTWGDCRTWHDRWEHDARSDHTDHAHDEFTARRRGVRLALVDPD